MSTMTPKPNHSIQKTISPIDGSIYVQRPLASEDEIKTTLSNAHVAQLDWNLLPLSQRATYLHALVDAMLAMKDTIVEELAWQMGRPISHGPGELRGFEERARAMIGIAESALENVKTRDIEGFERFIARDPLGVVFVVAPWNYPLLTSVNAVVPALMAGNSVILKHSAQTPLVAERYFEAAQKAGLPKGVFQYLHLSHDQVTRVIEDNLVSYVAFTGSVEGGFAVQQALGKRFITAGLELGGKDPAYVRPDADLDHAVATLVDGALFNAGQSCCGTERIYVHQDLYDVFIKKFVIEVYDYAKLGNPLDPSTTLGPVVRTSAADGIRKQITSALKAGAQALIDESRFKEAKIGTPYMAPQVLIDVDHQMEIMTEETFGPVVGIMRVTSDDQAVGLMNDSRYGLTASVFTHDRNAALELGRKVECGTWFMNRCDYLDPELAWVGIKDSGRGCTLSRIGYEQLTRPKSYHLKLKI